MKGGGREEGFLEEGPAFGAGLALGLSALENAGEGPKARKLIGGDIAPSVNCNAGYLGCNSGNSGVCSVGFVICNTGS